MEEEHWDAIGAPVYIRGFLRTYARYLKLDPEEAVAEFNATLPEPPAPKSVEPERSPASRAPRPSADLDRRDGRRAAGRLRRL